MNLIETLDKEQMEKAFRRQDHAGLRPRRHLLLVNVKVVEGADKSSRVQAYEGVSRSAVRARPQVGKLRLHRSRELVAKRRRAHVPALCPG